MLKVLTQGIVLVLVAFLLCLGANMSLALDVSIGLRPTQENVDVGEGFSMEVNVKPPVGGLKKVDVSISFDHSRVEYKSITKESIVDGFVEDIVPDPKVSNTTGRIRYSTLYKGPDSGIDIFPGGNKTILTVKFTAVFPGSAWVKLNPDCKLEHREQGTTVNLEREKIRVRLPIDIVGLLPADDAIKDWVHIGHYDKANNYDDLFDLINGGATLFANNGFKSAVFQIYEKPAEGVDNPPGLHLRIYDQWSEANAKAVYDIVDFDTSPPWNGAGEEARIDESGLAVYMVEFRQGDFFVQVIVEEKTDEALDTAKLFASYVSDRIQDAVTSARKSQPHSIAVTPKGKRPTTWGAIKKMIVVK